MSYPIASVKNLTVRRGANVVVDDVSFELLAESDTALVGPNGAGKSSLVASLLGLIPRVSGVITIMGTKMNKAGYLPKSIRERISYIPQNFSFQGQFPLSVFEFVQLGLSNSSSFLRMRDSRTKILVHRSLERTDTFNLRRRLLSELSGGELKRVMLAFCIVRPRDLLVLDEVQAGLDIPSTQRFQKMLFELRRQEGWTVLHISHDIDMVLRSSDQVLGLNRRLCCRGVPNLALTSERLSVLYGPNIVSYQHQCRG